MYIALWFLLLNQRINALSVLALSLALAPFNAEAIPPVAWNLLALMRCCMG
jgi:hypothetical protein